MTCGIYKITNKINGHLYIGYSSNIESRFSDHRTKPFSSKKKDDQNKALYRAIRKYGLENFDFEIIEKCEENKLKEREIYWIAYFDTYHNREHYNETPGGDGAGRNSIHLGEEHGMARLTEKEVIFCRECYAKGLRAKDVWRQYFKDRLTYEGFHNMWVGRNWKHIMPEVFKVRHHPRTRNWEECKIINERWNKVKDSMSFKAFTCSEDCFVGYGTAWNMVHHPEFYKGKK